MESLANLSSSEIGNIRDEREKALSLALKDYYTIEQEKLLLQKEILTKQTAKKDLEIALSKSQQILRQLNIEIKLLQSAFFNAKNSGL